MNKRKNSDMPDKDNPGWSDQDAKRAIAFDTLPGALQRKLPGRPKAAETKERITIRLSPDVLDAFRGTGAGWQTRIDTVLKEWVVARKGKRVVGPAKPRAVAVKR